MADRTTPVENILGWLRAGYPDGVPPHDYLALYGILRRSLTETEVDEIAGRLGRAGDTSRTAIQEVIREQALQEPSEDDIRRVASRLAAAGWPLAGAADSSIPVGRDGGAGVLTRIERIVVWLKGGYPHGIPEADYVPLLAVLRRRLSQQEIDELAARILRDGLAPAVRVDVGAEFLRVTDELPSEAEIRRISEKLAAAGIDVDYIEPLWARPTGS